MRFLAKKKNSKNGFFFRRLFSNSFPASRFVSRARRFFGLFSFFFLLIFLVFFLPTEAASGNEPRNERKIKQ